MAAPFEIPEEAKEVLSELATMPEAQYARLLSYVDGLPKDRLLHATLDRLEKCLPSEDRPAFSTMIHVLAQLARAAEASGLSSEQAIEAVVGQVVPDTQPQGNSLTQRLSALLQQESIQLHARALSLLYDEERVMVGCRLLTDIRPIFNEAGTQADHFIVVNHLHIMYREDHELRNHFFALDEDDIDALSALADRAKQKMKFLSTMMPAAVTAEEKKHQ